MGTGGTPIGRKQHRSVATIFCWCSFPDCFQRPVSLKTWLPKKILSKARVQEVEQRGWGIPIFPEVSACCCSVAQSCPTLYYPMDCSTPGFSVLHYLSEFAQTHVHWVGDAIQPSQSLSSPSLPPTPPNLSQHHDLFQWVGSLYHVAKVLEFQLQHQSLQWVCRVDFL